MAFDLLKNANIAAGGVLPMCQDTGTAIVFGKKGQRVWTGGGEDAALAGGIHRTYTETNLRYTQMAPLSMFEEVNTGNNLPAQIDIMAEPGRRVPQVPVHRQGRRLGQQELPVPADPRDAEPGASCSKFLETQIQTLGTAACPPYHLAIVIGGTSAELT